MRDRRLEGDGRYPGRRAGVLEHPGDAGRPLIAGFLQPEAPRRLVGRKPRAGGAPGQQHNPVIDGVGADVALSGGEHPARQPHPHQRAVGSLVHLQSTQAGVVATVLATER